MKRILFSLAFLLFAHTSFAQASQLMPEGEGKDQWFLQLAAFTTLENATAFQNEVQSKIKNEGALERKWGHFVSAQPNGNNYRVLLGPYPTKKDAEGAQEELAEIINSAIPLKYRTNVYYNYQYGYQFTWHLINENTYQDLYKTSLVTLDLEKFDSIPLGSDKSLIAHTNQINEEIFDLAKAKQLLQKNNFTLLQDDPQSSEINGYEINGEKFSIEWPLHFYAYYPTEDLIVFSGEGWNLLSLATNIGEWTLKMPYKTLYSPDKKFRITGSDFAEFGYGRYYIESYDKKIGRYVELIDLGVVSPWFNSSEIHGLAWLSDSEVIFMLKETLPSGESFKTDTRYYRVTIDSISPTN